MNMIQILKDKYNDLKSSELSLNENISLNSNVKTIILTLENNNVYFTKVNK